MAGYTPAIVPLRTAFDTKKAITEKIATTLSLIDDDGLVIVEDKNEVAVAFAPPTCQSVLLSLSDIVAERIVVALPQMHTSHIQLTSGSTGTGKAVAVTTKNVLANVDALRRRAEVTPYDVYVVLPLPRHGFDQPGANAIDRWH